MSVSSDQTSRAKSSTYTVVLMVVLEVTVEVFVVKLVLVHTPPAEEDETAAALTLPSINRPALRMEK